MSETQKWREAHPQLSMPEEALETIGSFPSLRLMDFIQAQEALGEDQKLIGFLKDLHREINWVYGNWQKVAQQADPNRLMGALMKEAESPGWGEIRKFLTDYAKANNVNPWKENGQLRS
jgi:hypothetical protein